MSTPHAKKVGYITDIEGNWDFFQSYIKLSSIIEYDSKQNLVFKEENTLFVFGGDVCDKGEGSIRITKQLVAFKKKYPKRVILILGNRDINKMRWTSELAQSEIDNVENVPGPYWVKKEAQVTPKQFLTKLSEQTKAPFQTVNTIANRIKWMLDATMGAAGDFDRRRKELSILNNKKNIKHITDDLVAASYLDSVKIHGEMYEFLSLGQLAFIHEGTLYVHGGINKGNLGYVPFSPTKFNNITEWVDKLNEWYRLEFLEWTLKPRWDYQKETKLFLLKWGEKFSAAIQGPAAEAQAEDKSKWSGRGAHRLMDYGLPTSKGSVVYAHMFNKFFNCQPVDPEVQQQLADHGIFRIVTGHQPHGSAPAVNKALKNFELIDSDSSYSDMTAPDNRGKAVSEVVIAGNKVIVNGIIHDGQRIKYKICIDGNEGDQYIGRRVKLPDDKDDNSFWVKAKLASFPEDGKEYLLCKVTGFNVTYDFMSKEKLDELIYGTVISKDKSDVCSIMVKGKEVPITKLGSVQATLSDITTVSFFRDWLAKIQNQEDLTLHKLEIQSVDYSGALSIRFIKLNAHITKRGESISGVMLLRGNSVAVFCVLIADDGRKFVVVVGHPRSAIGNSNHYEIPIGMEEYKSPVGFIRNLLQNECGIELETDTPINLSQYLFNDPERAIYVSAGSCDQAVRFYLLEKSVTNQQIIDIQSRPKSDGEFSQYETVLLQLEELELKCNDGNAIIAARLYDLYLKKKFLEISQESNEFLPLLSSSGEIPVPISSGGKTQSSASFNPAPTSVPLARSKSTAALKEKEK